MGFTFSYGTRIALGIIYFGLALAASACKPQGANTASEPARALPLEGQLAAIPLGDIAGAAKLRPADDVVNPFDGNVSAIEDGHRLFIAMNCAGCHGYDAKGGMGPNLTDAYWRYGGTPSGIYNSIYEGRPLGMPAWGPALPVQDIWKLVAYVQTLGGAIAATDYHAGLQGDHNLTSTAAEAHSPLGVFDNPSDATTLRGAEQSTPTPPPPSKKDP